MIVGERELMLSDLTAPYEFSWSGIGGSRAFQIPYDQLALPGDVVRAAAPRLRASPLHDLVRDHLEWLVDHADVLAEDPGATALGTATTELVRALIVSAADDARLTAPVMADTLLTRIKAYVLQHLNDPGLTPERIAQRPQRLGAPALQGLRRRWDRPGAVDHRAAAGGCAK